MGGGGKEGKEIDTWVRGRCLLIGSKWDIMDRWGGKMMFISLFIESEWREGNIKGK